MKLVRKVLFGLLLISASHLATAVSCGDSITSNLTLSSDLHCTTGSTALDVASSNVVINLNGYKISGSQDLAGITLNNVDNVTISGGSISDFFAGINTSHSSKVDISDITFSHTGHGVVFHQVDNSQIRNNDFIKTRSIAIRLYNTEVGETTKENTIENNEFYKTVGGIKLCGAGTTNNSLIGNLIWKSTDFSIHLVNSSDNNIESNEILESDLTALRLNYSSRNQISSNRLVGGPNGVSLLANGDTGVCESTGAVSSIKNVFSYNSIFEFDQGMVFGLGISTWPSVYYNTMKLDKIYDNTLGVKFLGEAWVNDVTGAAFSRNTTDVDDQGTANSY
ncbi:MAG: right-handed parallel beta-helix repeat-containing protein [Kangiellaceae bacterium]|nr:right-handed parallel beta-helix repeat-containing protein [Kangiellaceae bacterium]